MEQEAVDYRLEIQILQFWREHLSQAEFARFNTADLVRWYIAFDLAGPDDIRDKLTERHRVRPMPELLGVVPAAPHPPVTLIETWLETHENKVHSAPVWLAVTGLVLASFTFGLLFSTCSVNYNPSPLARSAHTTSPALNTPSFTGPTGIGGLTQVTPQVPGLPAPAPAPYNIPNVVSVPQPAPPPSRGAGSSLANPGAGNSTTH